MRSLAVALCVVSLAGVAAADDLSAARPQTVRIHLRTGPEPVQGYLRGRSADEVVLYTSEGRFRHVPLTDVQRLEVRTRTGTHALRGALIGVGVWIGAVAAASRGSLEATSWQSGALLAGTTAAGAFIGAQVPRYGWRATEPAALGRGSASTAWPSFQVTLRF